MTERVCILVAISDPEVRDGLAESLRSGEFGVVFASTVGESSRILAARRIALVFCEDKLRTGGFQGLLGEMGWLGVEAPMVVVSRTGGWQEYLAAVRLGALDMVVPPFREEAVAAVVTKALRQSALPREAAVAGVR